MGNTNHLPRKGVTFYTAINEVEGEWQELSDLSQLINYTNISNTTVSFTKDVLLTFSYTAIYPKLGQYARFASAQIFPKNIIYYTEATSGYPQGIAVAVYSSKYGAGYVYIHIQDGAITYGANLNEVRDVKFYIK